MATSIGRLIACPMLPLDLISFRKPCKRIELKDRLTRPRLPPVPQFLPIPPDELGRAVCCLLVTAGVGRLLVEMVVHVPFQQYL